MTRQLFISTVSLILTVFFSWTIAQGQTDSSLSVKGQQDYIILREGNGDTVWCAIKEINNDKIYYTINSIEWIRDKQEVKAYNWKGELNILSDNLVYSKDTLPPKIFLRYVKVSYKSSASMFMETTNALSGFSVGTADERIAPFGTTYKNIAFYLEDNKEAYREIKIARNCAKSTIITGCIGIVLGGITATGAGGDAMFPVIAVGMPTLVFSTIITYVSGRHYLKKSVRTYAKAYDYDCNPDNH
jgi:hypothetical protein